MEARRMYRSADYVIRHERGFNDRYVEARVPIEIGITTDDIGESRRMARSFASRFNQLVKSRRNLSRCMITGRNVDWGGSFERSFIHLFRSDHRVDGFEGIIAVRLSRSGVDLEYVSERKDRSGTRGRHVNSIEEEDSPFAIIRSSTDRLWD